jgi:hypothetical protein
LQASGDKIFLISPYDCLHVLTSDGHPLHRWWAGGFFYWEELGVWVDGNCPLPPCPLVAAIPDDRQKGLFWLVSRTNFRHFDFLCVAVGFPPGSGETFITAYDSEKELFSKSLRIDDPAVVNCEASGDYLYLTGDKLSRVAKKLWVVDQPGDGADAPPRVSCPDPDLAEASLALYHGDFDKAKECLKQVPASRLPAATVNKMLGLLEKLRKEAATKTEAQPKAEAAPKPVNSGALPGEKKE